MSKSADFTPFKYLREAKEELQKVTWPSREETTQYSVLVIVFSIILAVYFGLLDFLLGIGLDALLSLVS